MLENKRKKEPKKENINIIYIPPKGGIIYIILLFILIENIDIIPTKN